MEQTPKFKLPFIMPNQAQKHVTVNEAFQRVDTLAQLSVISNQQTEQPENPAEGDAYILGQDVTGADWAAQPPAEIAMFHSGSWRFVTPYIGWRAWNQSTEAMLFFDGTDWKPVQSLQTIPVSPSSLGVNTQADQNHRLAVKSDSELLSHDDVTPGSGDARKVINKAAHDKTASVIYQDGFSARAEIGLTGSNDLSFRVSADGSTFRDAATFDHTDATASFPNGITHNITGKPLSSILFTPGGDQEVSIYRISNQRAQHPRIMTISAVSGKDLSFTGAHTNTVFSNNFMQGVSMMRIWNISRPTPRPAWITHSRNANTIATLDAAAISDWQVGDQLQIGDPEEITQGRCIALDISPLMVARLGGAFPQTGIIASAFTSGLDRQQAKLEITTDGSDASFIGVSSTASGGGADAQITVASDVRSPVSNSNLVFIRETSASGQIGQCFIYVNALFV